MVTIEDESKQRTPLDAFHKKSDLAPFLEFRHPFTRIFSSAYLCFPIPTRRIRPPSLSFLEAIFFSLTSHFSPKISTVHKIAGVFSFDTCQNMKRQIMTEKDFDIILVLFRPLFDAFNFDES